MSKGSEKLLFDFNAVFEPDDYLYFYEYALTEEKTNKEIDFLVKELELQVPMEILDLACGHGRHSNKLAMMGYKVTGVDITLGFLKMAMDEARRLGVQVNYIQRDMRKIRFKEEFDRVLLLFTSFGYFEDEENLKVLKNVAKALKPKGLFCLDTINRDNLVKSFVPYIVIEKGEDLIIDRNSFDVFTGRMYNKRIVIRDGKRKDKPFFIRLYSLTEIQDLLKLAGLEIYKVYGDWDSSPFNLNSRRMIIIAKKE